MIGLCPRAGQGSADPDYRARASRDAALFAGALLCAAAPVCAQEFRDSTTSVMVVTLDIVASCTVSVADLSFGRYVSQSPTPQSGQTTLILRCSSGLGLEVGLDAGRGPGATYAERKLMSGTHTLVYSLYRDSARRQVWGDVPGVDTLSVTGTGTNQAIPIYGLIPAGQAVPPGEYGDVITLRLLY